MLIGLGILLLALTGVKVSGTLHYRLACAEFLGTDRNSHDRPVPTPRYEGRLAHMG